MSRFNVETVVSTPMTSALILNDLTEFLAACHRHGVRLDAALTVDVKIDGDARWFSLRATNHLEHGAADA